MDSKQFKTAILPLADRIFPMVARMLGSRENAEDAVQDIMMKLWRDREKVGNHPNITALVFTAARNHCIDRYRRNQMQIDSLNHTHHQVLSSGNHDEVEWRELNRIVQDILRELPENQAEVLMLRDLDGLEFQEIADALEITIANARMLLSRARKKMAEKLTTVYNYEHGEK